MHTYFNRASVIRGPVDAEEPIELEARVSIRDTSLDALVQDWRGFGIAPTPLEASTDYDLDTLDGNVYSITTDPPPEEPQLESLRTVPMTAELSFVVHVDTETPPVTG